MNGSLNGEQLSQDVDLFTNGRAPNPKKVNQFAMDSSTAKSLGLHLGQVVTFLAFSNKQVGLLETLTPEQALKKLKPVLKVRATLVLSLIHIWTVLRRPRSVHPWR